MKSRRQSDAIAIELIRHSLEGFVPSVIMSAGFVVCGVLMLRVSGDAILLGLFVLGALVTVARLAIAWLGGRESRRPDLTIGQARRLEWRFGASYLAFAFVFGLFTARVMQLPQPGMHMLTVCLIIGYSAGVAVTVGLRPTIAIPSMLTALLPAAVTGLSHSDELYWATSAMMVAFLVGGVQSLVTRYRRAVRNTARRLVFASLARKDGLTALPNRLALREWFHERIALAEGGGLIAVHCLDLNGFKPVNDTYGHPIGDALLAAVGQRLARLIRSNDIVARLGGDEFVVVQCVTHGPEEAEALARRIAEAVARPYRIGERELVVSTSIGYVLGREGVQDLDGLLGWADEALYQSKRNGRGITRYRPGGIVPERLAG